MKYKCLNKKCEKFNVEVEYLSVEYKVGADGRLVSDKLICPVCGSERAEINPNASIPIAEKNIGINEFSSLSKEDRIKSLKKRSHDHFEKNIKESKNAKIRTAVKNFRNE